MRMILIVFGAAAVLLVVWAILFFLGTRDQK
jgi:hypothetical protein